MNNLGLFMSLANLDKDIITDLHQSKVLSDYIQKNKSIFEASTYSKLDILQRQLLDTRKQILDVLSQFETSQRLNSLSISLRKVPGKTYHLYQSITNNNYYLSIISPKEWGKILKDKFIDSYIFNPDGSWNLLLG